MATAIDKNQYDYLNSLVSKGGGNGEWAKAQLANSTYTPPAPTTPVQPQNTGVPTQPTQKTATGVIPGSTPPKAPSTTTQQPNAGSPVNPGVQQYSDFQKQQSELMNQLKSYMQPMGYDPNTDPAYLARKQWSARQTDLRQQEALEGLAERGFTNVNNSMALQQAGQIAQDAQLADNAYSAQLEQQYYQRQRDRVADVFNLLQNSQNQQQRAYENMNTDRNFGLNQGQATGYYSPDSGTMESVRTKMAENSAAYANASPEEKKRLHEENLRLASSIGGEDTTGNGDYAFGPIRTVQGQQLDSQNKQIETENQQWDKQFGAQEAQRQWDNAFKDKTFDYQKAADLWERNFKDKTFEQSVKQAAQGLGIDYARMNQSQQQFAAEMAYKYKALELSQQEKADKPNKNSLESQYVSGFDSLTPDMRKQAFEENKATIIEELGLSGYDALFKRYFDEYGDPK